MMWRACAAAVAASIAVAQPRDLAVGVHHFVDVDIIGAASNVSTVLGSVLKETDAPVVVPEHAWEDIIHFYTSMVTIPPQLSATGARQFVVYYGCMYGDALYMYLCVANSTDGVTWTKPLLPYLPWEADGSPTNRVFHTNDTASWPGSVLLDTAPGVPPDEVFKLSYEGAGGERYMYVATSPDGFQWTLPTPITQPAYPLRLFSDTQTAVLWDGPSQQYVAFGRRDASMPGNTTWGCAGAYPSLRRVLRTNSSTSALGGYDANATEILTPGYPDPSNCLDIYNPAPIVLPEGPAADVRSWPPPPPSSRPPPLYLLLPSSFRHFSYNGSVPYSSDPINDGVLDIRLASSRDAGATVAFVSRDVFIPRGIGARDPVTGAFNTTGSDPDAGFVFATAGGLLDLDAYATAGEPSASLDACMKRVAAAAASGPSAWHRRQAAARQCAAAPAASFAQGQLQPYYTPSPYVWLLYRGTQATHTGSAHYWPAVFTGVLKARMRREGFAALATAQGDATGQGWFTTVPLVVPDPAAACGGDASAQLWLLLNVETSVAGNVTVAVLDASTSQPVPGYDAGSSQPVFGNAIRSPVGWTTASGNVSYDLSPLSAAGGGGGAPVLLNVSMVHARLYAWELQCVAADASGGDGTALITR